jgi:hypothetical protein
MKQLFTYLFTPHNSNNFRARVLHLDYIIAIICFVSVGSLGLHSNIVQKSNVLGIATDITIGRLLELTNEKRAANGLNSLRLNDALSDAGRRKANDMFTTNYWAHNNPVTGSTPWTWIGATGYKYDVAGENLAKNFMFSTDVVEGWMNSESHRKNLLKSEYEEVGFAVANGRIENEETTLVVQMFGKPQKAKPQAVKPTAAPVAFVSPKVPAPTKGVAMVLPQTITNISPTITPVALPTASSEAQIIVAATNTQSASQTTSGTKLLYNALFIFLGILVIAFIADWYIASHNKLIRIHSRNLAHVVFLLITSIGAFIIAKGGNVLP